MRSDQHWVNNLVSAAYPIVTNGSGHDKRGAAEGGAEEEQQHCAYAAYNYYCDDYYASITYYLGDEGYGYYNSYDEHAREGNHTGADFYDYQYGNCRYRDYEEYYGSCYSAY